MQQSAGDKATHGPGLAHVQTVSSGRFLMSEVPLAARVSVDAQREGGHVEEEPVFARRCRVSVVRIRRRLASG